MTELSRLDYIEGSLRELEGNIALAITKLHGDVGSVALIHRLAGDIGSLKNQVALLRRGAERNPRGAVPKNCDCVPCARARRDPEFEVMMAADGLPAIVEVEEPRDLLHLAAATILGLADQQAMPDDWYLEPLARIEAAAEGNPRDPGAVEYCDAIIRSADDSGPHVRCDREPGHWGAHASRPKFGCPNDPWCRSCPSADEDGVCTLGERAVAQINWCHRTV